MQNQQTDNFTTAPYEAVGTLHFTPGADGFGGVTGITASTTATSSGFALVYNTVGNVLTAYQDKNANGTYDSLTDTTPVFNLTVDPTATPTGQPATNHAGTYTFDLITALDNDIVKTAIGGATTFGAGPTGEQELNNGAATPTNLAILIGFSSSQTTAALAFDEATWTQQQVNSSVAGFGVNNDVFNTQEIFISDFHEASAKNVVLPTGQTNPFGPLIAYATYKFPGFASGDAVFYQAHYEDKNGVPTGMGAITQITSADLTGSVTVTAAVGSYLDYVVFFDQSGGGKFKLTNTGTLSATINQTITFTTSAKDGDGDIATTAPFTVHVGSGLSPLTPIAPIVFDLTGNGFHFASLAAGVAFDYGAGTAVTTAWAGSDDAILAIDLNGNGAVDNGSEIVFGGAGQTDLQGLAATYDTNHDGVLDARDAAFAQFGVWQDANGNGVSDPGEFRTLTEAGIRSISLVSDGKAYTAANGDVMVAGQSSFTRADGSIGLVADASFTTSALDKIATKSAEIVATTLAAAAAVIVVTAAAAATPDASTAPAAVVPETLTIDPVQHAMPAITEARVAETSLFDSLAAKSADAVSTTQHLSNPAPAEALSTSLHTANMTDIGQIAEAAANHPAFTLPTNLSGAMDALLTMAAQAGPLPDKVTTALPAVVEAIRDGAAAQAVDALIDHFAPTQHVADGATHIDVSALFAAVANDPGAAALVQSFDFAQAIHDVTAAMAVHA